jgi:hypothetical protein
MRKSFLLRLLAAALLPFLLLSCQPFGLDHPFGQPRDLLEGAGGPVRHSAGADATVWLTAVEFPVSYDWERDTAYGTVDCRIVLFSGKERVLSVDAGPSYEVSPDPDMHRAVGGHLYTDYSTDAETVIRRDGVELFRYPGREAIRGFLLYGGHVHTLGEDRAGAGFAYRIDGEAVFRRDEGVLLEGGAPSAADHPDLIQDGPLYVEGGMVCFSYYVPDQPPTLFFVHDGVEEAVSVGATVAAIMDHRLYNGSFYRVENRSGAAGLPFLVSGETSVQLSGEPRLAPSARKCTLVPYGDDMAVRGWYHYPDGYEEFHLWTRSGVLYRESLPFRAFSVLHTSDYSDDSGFGMASYGTGLMAYVFSPPGESLTIVKGTETWTPMGHYRLFTPSCARLVCGPGAKYYVALSGPSCILWVDGVVTPIPIHGYISGLTVE